MDARNMIASSSMRKGVSSNENANDITVHNNAILLTAASSEYRAVSRPHDCLPSCEEGWESALQEWKTGYLGRVLTPVA